MTGPSIRNDKGQERVAMEWVVHISEKDVPKV